MCVCVCAKRGDGRLIQVLPRRKDKNLPAACWASGSANRREFDPGDLRQGSPGCVQQLRLSQESPHVVVQRRWNVSHLNTHVVNLIFC